MSEFQKNLEKSVELAVKVGVNVQQGQTLVVTATLDAADVRDGHGLRVPEGVAELARRSGAGEVPAPDRSRERR